MSGSNSSRQFSIGRDCQVVMIHPLAPGGRVDIPNVTGFKCELVMTVASVKRMDGVYMAREIPSNWSFEFDCDRGNSALDDLAVAIQAVFIVSGQTPECSVYQYIQEPDGSVSAYELTNATIKFDLGAWASENPIKQKVMGTAFQRLRV